MDFALRIVCADDPAAEPTRNGHARIPKWITAIPAPELSDAAKVVLDAILGHCFGDSRECYPTLAQLSTDAGKMNRRKLQRALDELKNFPKHPLIMRTPERSRPGGNDWKTTVLFDPKGDRCPRLGGDTSVTTPRHQCHPPMTLVSPPPSLISTRVKQNFLEFERTTTTEPEPSSSLESISEPTDPTPPSASPEVVGHAAKLFPETQADPAPLEREISQHGISRVAMGLELAQLLAKDSKRKPRIFRWLHGTLENWRNRSTESIRAELDALRGPKQAEIRFYQTRPAADPVQSDDCPPEFWKAIKAGRHGLAMEMLEASAADEKPAAEPLAKDPPQPARKSAQGGVAAPFSRPANGAEGDRTLNLRIANATAGEPSQNHAKLPSEDRENAGQAAIERRVSNAALSPASPDPLDYTAESLLDQNHSHGSGGEP
jgi:hypothetical protein